MSSDPQQENEFLPTDVVCITGGLGGLGQEMARSFARAGVPVVVMDLEARADAADALIHDLSRHVSASFIPVDVTAPARVREGLEAAEAQIGPLSIWVNNAGTAIRSPALEVPIEDWQQQIDLNLTASFTCAQEFARRAEPAIADGRLEGAALVNVASVLGLVGCSNRAAYTATKGALVNLTRTLAVEWHDLGIRVNAVAPTFVETPLTLPLRQQGLDVLNRSLGEQWAEPSDVANGVRFLASRRARAITGHTLPIDYGWTAW